MPQVKGTTFMPRLHYIEKLDPQGYWNRLKSRLAPELANIIERGVLVNQWYPLGYYMDLNRAIDKVFGKGDGRLIWELGRLSADESLHGIYKIFFKVGSPEFIIRMAATVWKTFYDTGELSVVTEKENQGRKIIRLMLKKFDHPPEELKLAVAGWMERTLELSGARNLKLEISGKPSQPDTNIEFVASWE